MCRGFANRASKRASSGPRLDHDADLTVRLLRLDLGDHQAVAVRINDPHLLLRARGPVDDLTGGDAGRKQMLPELYKVLGVEVEDDRLAVRLVWGVSASEHEPR